MATFSADELGYTTLSQYGPLYLHNAVGMDVRWTGWAAALPHLVSIGSKLLIGPINDRMSFISDERRTKMWAITSTLGAMFCFVSLALLPKIGVVEVPKWVLQAVFTSVNAFTSLAFLGVLKSAIMVSLLLQAQPTQIPWLAPWSV
jgi:sugar phosphate permease